MMHGEENIKLHFGSLSHHQTKYKT